MINNEIFYFIINYQQLDEVANSIIFLNISSRDDYLFWLGRAFISMELPPFWVCYHENP